MTIPAFDPRRSAAIRSGLIQVVETPPRRLRLWQGVAAFAIAGALTGGAVSATAAAISGSTRPTPDAVGGQTSNGVNGIPAPAGTSPGAPVISMHGDLVSRTVTGNATLELTAPRGATHVRVTITCLTPGLTYWGTDPGGYKPSIACTAADLPDAGNTSYDFELGQSTALYITAPADVSSIVSYQFTEEIPTAWGVNARGETYGVPKHGAGEPDLLLVTGVDPSGKPIDGYARLDDLNGDLPDNPDDAATYDPGVREIPVYESDGVTQIGVFLLGAGSTP